MFVARMITLSEVLWGNKSTNIIEYSDRLFSHTMYLKKENINIANHLLDVKANPFVDQIEGVTLELSSMLQDISVFDKNGLVH